MTALNGTIVIVTIVSCQLVHSMMPMTNAIWTIDLTNTLMFKLIWLDMVVVSVLSRLYNSPVLVVSK